MKWSLLDHHADDDLVAFGAAGSRTRAHLIGDAHRVAAALPEPSSGSSILLVFENDRYAFAASALGAWLRGHSVALPPNTRRESVWAIQESDACVGMLHDTAAGAATRIGPLLGEYAVRGQRFEPAVAGPIATVYTSGSTGDARPWPKLAEQLVGEAEVLADAFGVGRGARVAATVPPGHIYGLLYSVLVPLCRGGAFLREVPLHVETVAERVTEAAADVLVTVPAHVRGLNAVEAGRLASVRRVFCSTAPLPDEAAAGFAERHRVAITEILGSSETGGIAWRLRSARDEWRPLPGVSIAVDDEQRLLVDSPFVDPQVERPYRTADLAELLPDGSFAHRGRADGVVKVGGRRVSLPAMQAAILEMEGVSDAAVVAVDDAGGRGSQILAAVCGVGITTEAIRGGLLERFEPSSLPRRVVFVPALPREDNGKLPRESVLRLLGLDPLGRPIRWDLDWSGFGAPSGRAFRCTVRVPETYGWYAGHFPGYPILAGAVQLTQIVAPAVARALPGRGRIVRLSRLKFTDRIVPGDTVQVEIDWQDEGTTVEFRLLRGGTTCSAGRAELSAG